MRLLVNTPSGKQEVLDIAEGGCYFDNSRVVWDERADGALPAITIGAMARAGNTLIVDNVRMSQHVAATAPIVPQLVSRRQARQALFLAGHLDSVPAIITAIPNANQKRLAEIEWQDSLSFDRNWPLVIQIATSLGMSSAQLDALFIHAASL